MGVGIDRGSWVAPDRCSLDRWGFDKTPKLPCFSLFFILTLVYKFPTTKIISKPCFKVSPQVQILAQNSCLIKTPFYKHLFISTYFGRHNNVLKHFTPTLNIKSFSPTLTGIVSENGDRRANKLLSFFAQSPWN